MAIKTEQDHKLFSALRFISTLALFAFVLYWIEQVCRIRLVGRDEGFYLLAADLVGRGKTPYIDFFYPQMPLLPYLYSGWLKLFGVEWYAARLFSGLAMLLIAFSLYISIRKKHGWWWAAFATILLVSCNLVFPWLTLVQTYSWAVLFLFLSCLCLQIAIEREDWAKLALVAGVFLGLSASIRLYFGCVGLAALAAIALHSRYKREMFNSLVAGCLIGFLPALLFVLINFDNFWFNNVGYHLLRSNLDGQQVWQAKLKVLEVLAGLHDSRKFDAPHFPLLLWCSVIGVGLTLMLKKKLPVAVLYAVVLALVSFVPTPTYVQYFCAVVPFLIVGLIEFLCLLQKDLKELWLLPLICILIFILWFASLPSDVVRYTQSGQGVIGLGSSKISKNWSIAAVQQVANYIRENSTPDSVVYSLWPGYLVGTDTRMVTGSENQFGEVVAKRLDPDLRTKYKVRKSGEMAVHLKTGQVDRFIHFGELKRTRLKKALKQGGYLLETELNGVKIFSRGESWKP